MKPLKIAPKRDYRPYAAAKRLTLALLMILACVVMTACYMEPDRVVDNNALNANDNAQNFQTVITNTPAVTATPTPAPTTAATDGNQQVDWSAWNFGDNNATNPPSNASATAAPQGGTITVGLVTNTPSPAPTGSSSSGTSTTSSSLKSGSKGTEVKNLQQRLKDLGYYTGSVDGSYGSGTASAVKAFQAANNLTADGVAGNKTLTTLYSSGAVKASATNSGSKPSSSTSSSSKPSTSTSTSTSSSYTNGRTDVYLQLGSSGKQVKILQNRLIVLGYLTGTADGDYSETTYAAVMAFQKRNSIYADGVAGPTTLTKLYSSSAKKAAAVVANLGSLKEGANGSAVRSLQQSLKTLGYYTGSVDGDYGAGTVAAVTAFQAANGLTADGIAGKATQNAIYAAVNGTGTSGGTTGGTTSGGVNPANYGSTASSNGYSTISASTGSKANVTAIQSALSAKGYYNGTLDGSFGGGTEEAVKAFQAAQGLRVTGMAGPTTQRLLYGGTSTGGSYSKLQPGDSGSKVKQLQYALYELKYYDGDITGSYDTATTNAVLTFQQVHGLTMDGIAGQQTQQLLYSSNAIPCNV